MNMQNTNPTISRLLQENASRPDHLPPSQGGKYVGFGSGPPPKAPAASGGVEEVTAMLSKGLYSFSTAAAATVRSGTATIGKTLQDKQVRCNGGGRGEGAWEEELANVLLDLKGAAQRKGGGTGGAQ